MYGRNEESDMFFTSLAALFLTFNPSCISFHMKANLYQDNIKDRYTEHLVTKSPHGAAINGNIY